MAPTTIVKHWPERLLRWQYLGLCILVVITLALHASIILQPNDPVFDETHYVKDARYIIHGNNTERTEHPPLGKLFIVAGILLFGDHALGWRFFSVVFGTLCIVFFYLICRKLDMPEDAVLTASLLLTLENLSFIQAGVAMLDVYSLTFMLGAFLLYLKGKNAFAGIAVGLSVLSKLSGALALPVIFLHWFFSGRAKPRQFLLSMLLAPVSFVALMPLFDFAITRQFLNPIDQIKTMLTLSGTLTFADYTSSIASRPWEWILRPQILWYWYDPHYTGVVSFTIWALIIPVALYMVYKATKGSGAALFGLSWFVSTYLLWIPANLITDRITFPYYLYHSVGAICIGLGLGLSQLLGVWKSRRAAIFRWAAMLTVLFYLLLHAGVFVILSPLFAGWVRILEFFYPPY